MNAPKAGEIFYNPDMARVLRTLGDKGATDGFYNGTTGQAIVEAVQKHGGVMTMKDLTQHTSLFPTPVSAKYRHVNLWQIPPNGQGVAGLVALSGLHHLEESGRCPKITPENINGAAAYHVQMEMMRLGFKDAREHVACPDHMQVTDEWLLDTKRIGDRAAAMFDPNKAVIQGEPLASSCTVSFQVVDKQGNAVSFVNRYVMDLIITFVYHRLSRAQAFVIFFFKVTLWALVLELFLMVAVLPFKIAVLAFALTQIIQMSWREASVHTTQSFRECSRTPIQASCTPPCPTWEAICNHKDTFN
jgi:hypothetical protein